MLKTVIVILILLSTIGLFGNVLIDTISVLLNAIFDSIEIFGYLNTILGNIGLQMPTLIKSMVIASFAFIFISILLKTNVSVIKKELSVRKAYKEKMEKGGK